MRKTYQTATVFLACALTALSAPGLVSGHGASGDRFRTEIVSIEPAGLPVDVRMTDEDQIRFENRGEELLKLCGYEDEEECRPWVRLGPEGVFEDRNSEDWYANAEGDEVGRIPERAGASPEWVKVRDEPAFYTYHDHRVHWMGGESAPPNVDEYDSAPQEVFTGTVSFRYGGTDGTVTARLDYIGGRTYFERYGEYALVGVAIVAMLVYFAVDARRRRREGQRAGSPHEADVPEPPQPQ